MPSSIIGIDLGATTIQAGLLRDAELQTVRTASTPADGSVDDVLQQMAAEIDALAGGEAPDGIGVGVPSVVDVERGIVYDVQNIPAWTEVPLKESLEARYDCPVAINNDANCFALGEHRFGAGRGHDAMIGLILGTGFAGGIIIDGKLYAGPNCGAGEFGTMPYRDGIFEHYCAGLFFEREYGISGEEAFRRAESGDAEARAMFAEMGHHLGHALKMVLYAYDPAFIVFGGSVRHAFPYFEQPMRSALEEFAFPRSVERLSIAVSELQHAAVLGAAALVDPSLSVPA